MTKINEKTRYNLILAIILVLTILGVGGVYGEVQSLGNVKQGTCIQLVQSCQNCTYTNVTKIQYPDKSLILIQYSMQKTGQNYNYTYCDTTKNGQYLITICSDVDGSNPCIPVTYDFNTGGSLILIIVLFIGAIIFLICTLFVNEEFFVYISGLLFLTAGVYIMIYGLSEISDMYSRTISYISLGIGFLFTVGAYIYNSYSKGEDEEIEE